MSQIDIKTFVIFVLMKYVWLLFVVLFSCNVPEKDQEEIFSEKHYAMPGLDHGLVQSPINILSFKADSFNSRHHDVTLHFDDKINAVENTGYSVQLDFEEGSTVEVDGDVFEFKQMHFHTPSEHLVDGVTYPMELHIVNIREGDDKTTPEYLVMSFLFKMSKDDNPFIDEFISLVPKEAHSINKIDTGIVKLNDLFEQVPKRGLDHYYHYKGSLTTPPFSESVHWYISKHLFEASPRQIQRINQLEGNNARHVQALFGRSVDAN
ncbi:carbonic anhydrase family protein [Cyclobacteriaceae bacterium]|nr:carbonic anhydrase family protein [Cyclobacteriaceae bacterium]